MALVGYLLSRSIQQIDQKLDRNCLATEQLKIQVHGYETSLRIHERRIEGLEHENNSLRGSLAAVDRQLAVMVDRKLNRSDRDH